MHRTSQISELLRRSLSGGRAAALLALLLVPLAAVLGGARPATAQEMTLPGLSGGQLREGDLRRGDVVAVVWASWPPRCRDVVEKLNAIEGRWGSQARVISINYQESRGDVERFLAGKSLRVPVYLDTEGEFSKKYSKPNLPVLLVFGGGEQVVKTALPDDPNPTIQGALQ
jgi:thiol-disulfide isomerase/thioredoxin